MFLREKCVSRFTFPFECLPRHCSSGGTVDEKRGIINEFEEDTITPRAYHKIVADLSDESIERITQGFAGKKLKLQVISDSLKYLEANFFPLPSSLTEEQFQQILKYDTKKGQTLYIDAINEGVDQNEEVLEKIEKEDQTYFQPLRISQELFDKHIGSDEELNVSIKYHSHEE